jgi:hypothetical protein
MVRSLARAFLLFLLFPGLLSASFRLVRTAKLPDDSFSYGVACDSFSALLTYEYVGGYPIDARIERLDGGVGEKTATKLLAHYGDAAVILSDRDGVIIEIRELQLPIPPKGPIYTRRWVRVTLDAQNQFELRDFPIVPGFSGQAASAPDAIEFYRLGGPENGLLRTRVARDGTLLELDQFIPGIKRRDRGPGLPRLFPVEPSRYVVNWQDRCFESTETGECHMKMWLALATISSAGEVSISEPVEQTFFLWFSLIRTAERVTTLWTSKEINGEFLLHFASVRVVGETLVAEPEHARVLPTDFAPEGIDYFGTFRGGFLAVIHSNGELQALELSADGRIEAVTNLNFKGAVYRVDERTFAVVHGEPEKHELRIYQAPRSRPVRR